MGKHQIVRLVFGGCRCLRLSADAPAMRRLVVCSCTRPVSSDPDGNFHVAFPGMLMLRLMECAELYMPSWLGLVKQPSENLLPQSSSWKV